MEEQKKPMFHLEVEATKEEIKEEVTQEGVVPRVSLRRTKKKMVDKMTTPLWQLEDMFLSAQEGKNNSDETVKYYKKCFRNLYQFLAFTAIDATEEYAEMLKKYPNEAEFGSCLPIMYLEMDDMEQRYKEYLFDVREVNEQTVNNLFRGYRAIAYFAMDNGWIEKRRISIKEVEPPIKNTYTEEELDMLLRKPNPDSFSEYRCWVMVCYLLATGNRIGSIVSLKVGDVDLEEGYVNVNTQKNRTPIRIPLVKSILPKLKEFISEYRTSEKGTPLYDEPLFCNPYGQALTRDAAEKAIATYNRARGVDKTSIHLFRHTFAKHWILDGGDILTLQKMLGQKTLKMVQRYANLYAPDVKPKAEEHAILNNVQSSTGRRKLQRRGK